MVGCEQATNDRTVVRHQQPRLLSLGKSVRCVASGAASVVCRGRAGGWLDRCSGCPTRLAGVRCGTSGYGVGDGLAVVGDARTGGAGQF